MKRLILAAALALGGCNGGIATLAAPPTPTTIVAMTAACETFDTSLDVLAAARKAQKLSPAQVTAIDQVRALLNPTCHANPPPSATDIATSTVLVGIGQLAAIKTSAGVK